MNPNKPLPVGLSDEEVVKQTYPDAHIRKTSNIHFAVFSENKRLGGRSQTEPMAWAYAKVDPLFTPSRREIPDADDEIPTCEMCGERLNENYRCPHEN